MAKLALFVMQFIKKHIALPQEAVVEKVYFKYNYKKFVVQYYPSKPEEKTLWAIKLKDGTPYYLGKITNGVLDTPTYGEMSNYHDYLVIKGADRLYKYVQFPNYRFSSDGKEYGLTK